MGKHSGFQAAVEPRTRGHSLQRIGARYGNATLMRERLLRSRAAIEFYERTGQSPRATT